MEENHKHSAGCMALVRSYFPGMKPAYKRIATFILQHPEETLNMSIIQVAKQAGVSPGTVTRFCCSIGYSGFPDFKSALRIDMLSIDNRFREELRVDDPVYSIVDKVFDLAIQGLRDTLVTLDPAAVARAAEAILDAEHVYCGPAGMASSGIVPLLGQKLLNLGILLVHFENPAMAPRYIDIIKPKDVVIGISHSGTSPLVVDFIEQCREHGATTICITNHIDAPLVKVSDIPLITAAAREAPLLGEPITVRLSQVAVVDTLYAVLSIMKHRRERGEGGGEHNEHGGKA